jgi:hypothetical protein
LPVLTFDRCVIALLALAIVAPAAGAGETGVPTAAAIESGSPSALATGPGSVAETVVRRGYTIRIAVGPNKALALNSFALQLSRAGRRIRHGSVSLAFEMADMQMPRQQYELRQTRRGVYTRALRAPTMAGRWDLSFTVLLEGARPLTIRLIDSVE